jgi:hypothetical protein
MTKIIWLILSRVLRLKNPDPDNWHGMGKQNVKEI